jgi:1-acyl-sn-glycerol-3-phosphate acyltransferase
MTDPAGPSIGARIGSAFIWAIWLSFTALWTPVVAIVYLLTAWWDRRRFWAGSTFRLGAKILIALNPWWHCRIEGEPPARDLHPFVAVSNHESLADILIIGTLPWEMKWMSKESIFKIPFLGWMMRMAGDVSVKRNSVKSRGEAYAKTREWIERGSSVMIFPEGTRSKTRDMLPFRNGAFRLAVETGRPVQPIAVSGTRDAIRKGTWVFGRADVVVRVLQPVSVETAGAPAGPDEHHDEEATALRLQAVTRIRDLARARIEAGRSVGVEDLTQQVDRDRF